MHGSSATDIVDMSWPSLVLCEGLQYLATLPLFHSESAFIDDNLTLIQDAPVPFHYTI